MARWVAPTRGPPSAYRRIIHVRFHFPHHRPPRIRRRGRPLGAGVALGADTRVQRLFVAQQPTGAPIATSDAWLDHLKGRHRQLFDVPEPEGGTALRHVRNYLDAWRDEIGRAHV